VPTYGYRCSNCGHQFEIHQRITDAPLTACPKCQGKLAKVLYPTGVIFKGSGFYSTDYKSSSGKSSESSNGSAPSNESKPESKSETKTETKTESKSGSSD
jgi:putative FmdB family regulatory protein